MLRLRPTFEQIEREARTSRLRILPEKQKRTQQGILFDDVNFDDFNLGKYDRRNRATQTDMFNEPSSYSSASSNRSVKTAIEGNEDGKQDRQVSFSSGESLDDARNRARMSIADDLATMARVGGEIIYYTGQSIGQGINMAVDAYNWMNEDEEDDEEPEREAFALLREPPINEEVFQQTQHIIRRGASRSRSPEQNEQASGSNDAIRLLRRGASRSRSASRTSGEASRSSTPPKKNEKK